jgi:hypothetical protein
MSQDKKRMSLKGMTDDEKRERKKIVQREYMARRRKEDPQFAKEQRELCANRIRVLRENPEFCAKEKEQAKQYRERYKDVHKELRAAVSQFIKEKRRQMKEDKEIANLSLKIDSVSYF